MLLRDLFLRRRLFVWAGAIFVIVFLVYSFIVLTRKNTAGPPSSTPVLRVLGYSSFVASWGPGPEIARKFQEKTGISVELRDADDAGLLLKKLEIFPSDVVIGFDQLILPLARKARTWKTLPSLAGRFHEKDFVAIDWGPLAFVYREGEIDPPRSLDDLLDQRFNKQLALQDPRTSSPGLQFLFWLIEKKTVDGAFAFLEKLRPSIHTVASSWSTSYGIFQNSQTKMALSYLTSPLYHQLNENDSRFKAAVFSDGHPLQVEYAGVPDNCRACENAIEFVRFLLEPEIQKLIMVKNVMLPAVMGVEKGTLFEALPEFTVLEINGLPELIERRDELLTRWRALQL